MLDPFAQLFQHCWGHARLLRMVYKDLWVVSFPRCTAGPNIAAVKLVKLADVKLESSEAYLLKLGKNLSWDFEVI